MVDSILFKILYVIMSYLLGSVLFALIIARFIKKQDLRKIDRPGTAGAGRQYGWKAGLPTFIFDCGKGVAVVLIGKVIGLDLITIAASCIAMLIGHNWPIFFGFQGGGGIATTMGIAVSLVPVPALIVIAFSLAVAFTYKFTLGKKHKVNANVVGAALGTFLMPFATYIYGSSLIIVALFAVMFLIILAKGLRLHFTYRKIPTAN